MRRGEPATSMTVHGAALVLALAVAAVPFHAWGAAISPKVLERAGLKADDPIVVRGQRNLIAARKRGIDKVYPQFALDLSKFPRDGVAHRNILVVLCQFAPDFAGSGRTPSAASTPFYYHRLFFSEDPNDEFISLREYYLANSGGRLVVSGQVTRKWLTMPHSYDYYVAGSGGLCGGYPYNAQRLAEDAMRAAVAEFDGNLRYFDNDGPDGTPSSGDDDGYIDAVYVIHPGVGGETTCLDPCACNVLWAHQGGIAVYDNCPPTGGAGCLPGIEVGGVRGFLYLVGSEYTEFPGDRSVGTYCHEFGHTLGLPDLYDLTGRGGLGFYSLMSLGNYLPFYTPGVIGSRPANLDAWCRQFLGFDEPITPNASGRYDLAPATGGGGSLRVWTNGVPGTEYFLVENRIREGLDLHLPGEGLLVYHIDDTEADNLSGPGRYRVSLVQADGLRDLETLVQDCSRRPSSCGDEGDPYPGSYFRRDLTESTTPDSRDLLGLETGVRLTNITGAADGDDIASFDLEISRASFLSLAALRVADGADGYADLSETDTLHVTLRNIGLPSGGLSLVLSTSDPDVTVVEGTASIPGGIDRNATATPAAPFVVAIGGAGAAPRDIPFNLAWDDGSSFGIVKIPLSVGLSPGLSAGFEAGLGAWTSGPVPPTSIDQWHASTSRADGGSAGSAKLGSTLPLGSGSNEAQTYANDLDAALVSPAFDLLPGQELVFSSYVDAETNGGAGAWDGGRVELSINGGIWRAVSVDGGYTHQVEHNATSSLRGQEIFSGSPQRWRRVVADLSSFSGPARVRFRFASDDGNWPVDQFFAQLRYYEGWYVDNVLVRNRTVTGPTPRRLSLRAGPSPYRVGGPSAGTVTFRFSAPDGLPHAELRPVVRVFDVQGRLVRALEARPHPLVPSEFRAEWDGSTRSGGTARAGVYFAAVDVAGSQESVRLVLVH